MASSARQSMENARSSIDEPGASNLQSLSRAVYARRAEYTRPQKIKIKVGSWNVAACPGTEKDLRGWFAEGKGVDTRLADLKVTDEPPPENTVESVEDQEQRRNKKESTLPKGDVGIVPGGEEIGLYVLGLQEVVDLTSTTKYIGRVYNDPGPMTRWRNAMTKSLPAGYSLVAEQQLSGLLLLIFASPSIAPTISSISTVSVGTGLMGYLGNKGAVTTRIVLGETTRMVFVNSHLASGNEVNNLERRCWDVSQILQRTSFDPITWAGAVDDRHEGIGDEDFAFWFGDLNFRLDGLPGEDIRRLLMLHTKGEYGIGAKGRDKINDELERNDRPIVIRSVDSDEDEEESEPMRRVNNNAVGYDPFDLLPDPDDFIQDPSQDPTSLQATLDSLLPHDQLGRMQKKKKVFHDGWREGPITFLPTYKYDVGSVGVYDSSEKKRAPSWCDRILYRTRRDKLEYDSKSQDEELARIRDTEMRARGMDRAREDEEVLFDYDPEEDGDNIIDASPSFEYDEYDQYEPEEPAHTETVITKEGYVDKISLDVYTSHQRVISSDHKPLDAVFTLEYDAIVPDLKSKVQAEVARDLDRAENEGRPGITVVVDNTQGADDIKIPDGTSSPDSAGDADGVDFGSVAYQQRKTRNVTIANTSQVPATFAFVGRPSRSGDEDIIAPPWLSVFLEDSVSAEGDQISQDLKRQITLQPGDTVNGTMEVFVDDLSLAKALNCCKAKLEDVLVLRVTDGRDHFIPIRAFWLQSCFGRSIEELIHIPEGGVRALRLLRSNNSKDTVPVNRGQDVRWSAPRELFKLTEAVEKLTERVIADANMIESAQIPQESLGWPFDSKSWLLKDIKARELRRRYPMEALDADLNLNDSFPPEIPAIERLEIIAEILLTFLDSLTDGIVTSELWTKLEQDMNARGPKQLTDTEEIKTWVLDVLASAPNHNISFVFLTTTLCRVASEIVPVGKSSWKLSAMESARSRFGSVRRSLSLKARGPPEVVTDPAVEKRAAVERAFADVFAKVIFRSAVTGSAKEKRVGEERKREILEAFVQGERDR